MPDDFWKFVVIYVISLLTGMIGSIIAMLITGVNKFQGKKWKALLVIPFFYTIIVFFGILNIFPLNLSQSVVQNAIRMN